MYDRFQQNVEAYYNSLLDARDNADRASEQQEEFYAERYQNLTSRRRMDRRRVGVRHTVASLVLFDVRAEAEAASDY